MIRKGPPEAGWRDEVVGKEGIIIASHLTLLRVYRMSEATGRCLFSHSLLSLTFIRSSLRTNQ